MAQGGGVSRRWIACDALWKNKNGPAAAIPWWYWPGCRSSVAGREHGCCRRCKCRCRCTGERPVLIMEFQADRRETEKVRD